MSTNGNGNGLDYTPTTKATDVVTATNASWTAPSFADMSSQQRSASMDNIARQVEGLTRQVNALTAKMTQAQRHANDTTFTLEQLQCAVADNALDISRLARIAALLRRIDRFVFKARHAWTMIRYRLARLVKKA